ncbi:MAG: hypothetical protein A3J09_01790 [Candidatus Zambryskibacteria bacterium RIFCSPLOWO2_02_FULL_51_21]|uniref:Uncharacterized protein n=1 Tax=Candidatus Zambryskibacteria bacterium RIFCSPHIGHO2_02_FULL_43_37 TaxID=1802749 RepID=A0A1G2TIH1_9BACT|nr:MAG: hypothetical protein A2723_01790 [Candidatus Zambryskibacteria bacterium RIFCSPHIGHO2_01_FULL_52_18]OHA96469.1 MAG: hypothetical protein A3D49_01110 [Candidatus Zambryskibacteria bacterium RIFCSPHIGHO2_02_FULL_43_37]OHB07228.1 MAG: hypothetical protein A2944_01530 [Candidatus Zambryskibacteria bacterium RIFCSPLOWO2_01_FULL_52_12]OHB11268.1 MAG: hypothetical protein A3J09_01790 [Candidatus Zambryskibacteria bacterium RIFCSPLOWO2_02_FULL_51_21]
MNALLENKKAIVALVVLVLGFFIYSMVVGPQKTPTAGETSPGEDLVKTAEKLSSINFDQALFKTSGYKSLIDWSPAVPAQPTGRANPFEVIGRD